MTELLTIAFQMNPRLILSIFTFSLLIEAGCNVGKTNLTIAGNDTSQVLKLVIDSAFYHHRLPDYSALTKNNPFHDTIIFKFDSTLVRHLPNDLKCKLLSQDEICSLATRYYNDSTYFCNFLKLNNFTKIDDTTYEVSLQNQCVMPLYDKNGRPKFDKDFIQRHSNYKCWFGYLCGGGMAMTVIKKGDTLRVKIEGFWSN